MIGSLHEFHDSVYLGRRPSTSATDSNLRNSIDENSNYDDLMKVRSIDHSIPSSANSLLLGNHCIT